MFKLTILYVALAATAFAGDNDGDFLGDVDVDSAETLLNDEDSESSLQVTTKFSADVDLLINDDINIQRYSGTLDFDFGDTTLGLTYRRIEYELDIFGRFFSPTNRAEETDQYSLNLGQQWTNRFSSSLSLAGYEGFTNFRSIWITESFDSPFRNSPSFIEADPFGYSVSLTNTLILPNDFDSISLNLGYSRDNIAIPIDFNDTFTALVRDDRFLETYSGSLTGTFYIPDKITSEWFARASFITEREVRLQFRAKAAWDLPKKFTLRGEIGTTIERPDFDAFYVGLTLNYEILSSLNLTIGYRIYTDSGEITPSNQDNAAPAFDSSEISAALLWSRGDHALSASVAFLQTEFDEVDPLGPNTRLAGLFSDRDFLAVRAAYSYQF